MQLVFLMMLDLMKGVKVQVNFIFVFEICQMGNVVVIVGIVVIVFILVIVVVVFFVNLLDVNVFNVCVEILFVENDDLIVQVELKLLEIFV